MIISGIAQMYCGDDNVTSNAVLSTRTLADTAVGFKHGTDKCIPFSEHASFSFSEIDVGPVQYDL